LQQGANHSGELCEGERDEECRSCRHLLSKDRGDRRGVLRERLDRADQAGRQGDDEESVLISVSESVKATSRDHAHHDEEDEVSRHQVQLDIRLARDALESR